MNEPRIVLIVAGSLAATVLLAVVGSLVLAAVDTETPALVEDVAKVALGALGALLVQAQTRRDPNVEAAAEQLAEAKLRQLGPGPDPVPVVIDQPAGDPVPVVEHPAPPARPIRRRPS